MLLPKRWILERTYGWLGRCRRLAMDFEHLTRSHVRFVLHAMIRLMSRRIVRLRIATKFLRTDSKTVSKTNRNRFEGCLANEHSSIFYNILRPTPKRNIDDALQSRCRDIMEALIGPTQGMWRQHDVIHLQEWVADRRWLLLEYIEADTCNYFCIQRNNERRFVDDRAARHVDQVGAWFHHRDACRIDEVSRFWRQLAADDDEVSGSKQLFQVDEFTTKGPNTRCVGMGIGG